MSTRLDWLDAAGGDDSATVLRAPGGMAISRRDLRQASLGMAGSLDRLQVRRGSVVALALPDGPRYLAAFWGIARAAACAPLNPSLAPSEMETRLRQWKAAALVVDSPDSAPAGVARRLGIPLLESRGEEWRVEGRPSSVGRSLPEEVVLLLETSATTGQPKLVPLEDATLGAMARNSISSLQLTAEDRLLSLMPLFHLQGLLTCLIQVAAGGPAMVTPGFEARNFMAWWKEFRPTWYTAGPTLHRAIVTLLREQGNERPGGLRFVRSIGAAMPAEWLAEIETALGAPLVEGYGLTEAGSVTSSPLPPRLRKPGSAGCSTGAELAVLDSQGRPVAAGAEGEISVRGANVFHGYLRDPEANRRAFVAGWLRTGDLGRVDSEGYLFVTGRIKEMINRGGEKIVPQEVDAALGAHPAVAEAAAFGMPHVSLGEDVAAVVVLRPGAATTEEELRDFAAARVAAFKVPRRIFIVPEIPKGATGKARRHLLAGQVRAPFAAPTTASEQAVASVWGRILRSERIGADDDFFAAGGDSLAATVMMLEVERETGRTVEPQEFFANPTVRALSRLLDQKARPADSGVITFQSRGAGRPFLCLAGASEDYLGLRHLAGSMGADRPFHVLRTPPPDGRRGALTVEELAQRMLERLRSLELRGPYLLGGYCFGGIVAFEMARRLADAGDARLVILINTPAPGFPKVMPQMVRHREGYWRTAVRVTQGERGEAHQMLGYASKLLALVKRRTAGSVDRALVRAGAARLMTVPEDAATRNTRAARQYVPAAISARVVQFLSSEGGVSETIWEDSRLAWRAFAGGGFASHVVPGTHTSMIEPPNVATLAETLRGLLSAEDRETPPVGDSASV